MTQPATEVTRCAIHPADGKRCFEPAHVVLFATTAGPFAGQDYRPGDRVLACLHHGSQLYDAIHRRRYAPWLPDGYTGLPATRMPYHRTQTPARPRESTTRRG